MSKLEVNINGTVIQGELLESAAPKSVDALCGLLPMKSTLLHVRWSGYATWINLEGTDLPDLPRENHTVYPSCGDVLLYPGYQNDKELLFSCGPTCFKSPAGEQAGNHVATINVSRDTLGSIETRTLEEGGQDITLRIRE